MPYRPSHMPVKTVSHPVTFVLAVMSPLAHRKSCHFSISSALDGALDTMDERAFSAGLRICPNGIHCP